MQEDRRRRTRILVFVEELGLAVLCVFSASNCALVFVVVVFGKFERTGFLPLSVDVPIVHHLL